MKYIIAIIVVLLIIAGVGILFFDVGRNPVSDTVASFAECAVRYPVMESYPRRCNTPEGLSFTEPLATTTDLIEEPTEPVGTSTTAFAPFRFDNLRENQVVTSPLTIRGFAPGTWYFEASFPVTILDDDGNILAQGPAQAKSDWMTTADVPFEITLTFVPTTATGRIRFENDNPSGLPENSKRIEVPVTF